MSTTKTPTPKLVPQVTKTTKAAAAMAQQDGRKRPVVAINEEGKLVVCCRRTAKKNGWQVQDVLYERSKPAKVEAPVPEPAKAAVKKPAMNKVKAVKEFVDTQINDILGK